MGGGCVCVEEMSRSRWSIIYKAGFRSLGEGELVEFESKPSDKGVEATFVCGIGGAECRGSDRRPMSRKKFKKISVSILEAKSWLSYLCNEFVAGGTVRMSGVLVIWIPGIGIVVIGSTSTN
ncbi:hypothetical protein C0Q70_10801 [Pomacea canaliculata]|uniref:Uncharacterized protein n=1 Tax=Pomacea canaliculata TaxID=400727 RepID=A0A2T7P464_POMCA|nr:hypothetical protein C0Q70_10801 [Pomacea canaliculata]